MVNSFDRWFQSAANCLYDLETNFPKILLNFEFCPYLWIFVLSLSLANDWYQWLYDKA